MRGRRLRSAPFLLYTPGFSQREAGMIKRFRAECLVAMATLIVCSSTSEGFARPKNPVQSFKICQCFCKYKDTDGNVHNTVVSMTTSNMSLDCFGTYEGTTGWCTPKYG